MHNVRSSELNYTPWYVGVNNLPGVIANTRPLDRKSDTILIAPPVVLLLYYN